jgi:hypothetical protein
MAQNVSDEARGLVKDLLDSLETRSEPISQCLLKAKRLARLLRDCDAQTWLDLEFKGILNRSIPRKSDIDALSHPHQGEAAITCQLLIEEGKKPSFVLVGSDLASLWKLDRSHLLTECCDLSLNFGKPVVLCLPSGVHLLVFMYSPLVLKPSTKKYRKVSTRMYPQVKRSWPSFIPISFWLTSPVALHRLRLAVSGLRPLQRRQSLVCHPTAVT